MPPPSAPSACECHRKPFRFFLFQETPVGIDKTNGRNGEVSIRQCRQCGVLWLYYYYEKKYEAGSGRWYMGRVSPDDVFLLLPQQALPILKEIPVLWYGGAYYGHTGHLGPVQVEVD